MKIIRQDLLLNLPHQVSLKLITLILAVSSGWTDGRIDKKRPKDAFRQFSPEIT
jgi:hypothetical protein